MIETLSFKRRLKNTLPKNLQALLTEYKRKLSPVKTTPSFATPRREMDRLLPCLVAYNDFGGYCVPRSSIHRPVAQAVVRGKVWEEQTLRFIAACAPGGDIVHAGTYYGDFLPAMSSFCSGDAQVWAFEPGTENFRCAEITILINGLDNVHLINAGLGDVEGDASLTVSTQEGKSMGGLSRIVSDHAPAGAFTTQRTRIVTIDATVPASRPVSVIQLDVEGFEQKALAGALATIERWRPTLVLETVPEKEWLDRHIFSLGYQAAGRVDENVAFNCDKG